MARFWGVGGVGTHIVQLARLVWWLARLVVPVLGDWSLVSLADEEVRRASGRLVPRFPANAELFTNGAWVSKHFDVVVRGWDGASNAYSINIDAQ